MKEAVRLGDSYNFQSSNQAKCFQCSKINVAAVSYGQIDDPRVYSVQALFKAPFYPSGPSCSKGV